MRRLRKLVTNRDQQQWNIQLKLNHDWKFNNVQWIGYI